MHEKIRKWRYKTTINIENLDVNLAIKWTNLINHSKNPLKYDIPWPNNFKNIIKM